MSREGVAKNPWRGRVVKVSSDGRTIRVHVPTSVFHSKYKKILHRFTRLHADTAGKVVGVGQEVDLLPCRRISKTKSWMVTAVYSMAHAD